MVTRISSAPPIELHEVPQKKIQRILLDDDKADVEYVQIIDDDENTSDPDQEEDDVTTAESVPNTGRTENTAPKETDVQTKTDGTAEETVESGITVNPAAVQDSDGIAKNRERGQRKPLEEVRVFIGKDKYNNKVYWDFGHPKLANRHLLITGTSGQGKTYSIQAMLKELAQNGISSVIFDYTEGFRENQLEPPFRNALADRIKQNIVYDDTLGCMALFQEKRR